MHGPRNGHPLTVRPQGKGKCSALHMTCLRMHTHRIVPSFVPRNAPAGPQRYAFSNPEHTGFNEFHLLISGKGKLDLLLIARLNDKGRLAQSSSQMSQDLELQKTTSVTTTSDRRVPLYPAPNVRNPVPKPFIFLVPMSLRSHPPYRAVANTPRASQLSAPLGPSEHSPIPSRHPEHHHPRLPTYYYYTSCRSSSLTAPRESLPKDAAVGSTSPSAAESALVVLDIRMGFVIVGSVARLIVCTSTLSVCVAMIEARELV